MIRSCSPPWLTNFQERSFSPEWIQHQVTKKYCRSNTVFGVWYISIWKCAPLLMPNTIVNPIRYGYLYMHMFFFNWSMPHAYKLMKALFFPGPSVRLCVKIHDGPCKLYRNALTYALNWLYSSWWQKVPPPLVLGLRYPKSWSSQNSSMLKPHPQARGGGGVILWK